MAAFLTDSQAVSADPSYAWPYAGDAVQAALACCSAHLTDWVQAVAVVLEPAAAHVEPADADVHAAAVGDRQHPAAAAAD